MIDVPTTTGLKFFGAVTASISHELKNRFAIVNEQAGLLTDLVLMAENGKDLDPGRLKRLAESVKKQVTLADDLLRHMNRFSHSVDAIPGETDLSAMLTCVAALARRTADRRNVQLAVHLPEIAPMVRQPAFWVMNLVWVLMEGVMGTGSEQRTLDIYCEMGPEGALIRIDGAAAAQPLQQAAAAATDLAAGLEARVSVDPDRYSVSVRLPR